METILQSLKRIEDVIYSMPYDNLTTYLQGVRDMINLVNGEEYSAEVVDTILKNLETLGKHGTCPKCKSENITYCDGYVKDEQYIYECVCDDCEAEFKEINTIDFLRNEV